MQQLGLLDDLITTIPKLLYNQVWIGFDGIGRIKSIGGCGTDDITKLQELFLYSIAFDVDGIGDFVIPGFHNRLEAQNPCRSMSPSVF